VIIFTLRALAMCTLSCMIARMSCRLYLSTGHWPVWNQWDFAPPSQMRMLNEPIFAAASTPPGPPVT
jgi:hypothetical protein